MGRLQLKLPDPVQNLLAQVWTSSQGLSKISHCEATYKYIRDMHFIRSGEKGAWRIF